MSIIEKGLPELRGENFGDMFFNFFRDLGWDDVSKINPTKVKMNEDDWTKYCDKLADTNDKGVRLAIRWTWMNKGPSGRPEVPSGKILLEEGWME